MAVNNYNAKTGTFNEALNRELPSNVIKTFTSTAGTGGAATEAMALTGLLATDIIIAVQQKTKGANNLPLLGWTTQAANALTCVWSAAVGAGAVVVVTVMRPTT